MSSERQQINSNAGIRHTLSRQILGIDWYDTESSARRVIEWLAEGQEPVATVTGRSGNMLRVGWLNPDVCEVGGMLYAAPVAKPQLNLPDQDRYFEIVSGVFGKGLGHELAMKLALVTGTIHNEIISLNPTPAKPPITDSDRLEFMLTDHRKVVVECLPGRGYELYVEQGFMGDSKYPAVSFNGGHWENDSDKARDLKRKAIDVAITASRADGCPT